MKPAKPYLLNCITFFLLAIIFQSCSDQSGAWKNEEINSGKREHFHELNEQAFKSLKANNPKQLGALLSRDLIDNEVSTKRMVELISNQLNDNKYKLLDEYYVINSYIDADTIQTTAKDINSHNLNYPGTTRMMYIALFIPDAGENKYMVSLIYSKFNYGWKISQWDLSPYTINGKTAPELFKYAKEQYSKTYLIDAVNTMALAITCTQPSSIWHYICEADISDFYNKLINKANDKYKFPFTLNQVATKPRIFRIFNQTTPEGSYPMVYYLSQIKLNDTTAIKNENEQIKKIIGEAMPGIDKDKKYILYSAFNVKPGGGKTVDHYDINEKLP